MCVMLYTVVFYCPSIYTFSVDQCNLVVLFVLYIIICNRILYLVTCIMISMYKHVQVGIYDALIECVHNIAVSMFLSLIMHSHSRSLVPRMQCY